MSNKKQDPAIVFAAHNGKIDEVSAMLQSGVDVNSKANGGKTALHVAAGNSNIEIVKLLLSHKHCDINIKDDKGRSPSQFAEAYGRVNIAKLIQSHEAFEKDILHEAMAGNLQTVAQCIKSNPKSVTKQNHDRKTALHMAAAYGHAEVVKLLLKSGSSTDAKDSKGRTPSQFAKQYKQVDVQNIILDYIESKKEESQENLRQIEEKKPAVEQRMQEEDKKQSAERERQEAERQRAEEKQRQAEEERQRLEKERIKKEQQEKEEVQRAEEERQRVEKERAQKEKEERRRAEEAQLQRAHEERQQVEMERQKKQREEEERQRLEKEKLKQEAQRKEELKQKQLLEAEKLRREEEERERAAQQQRDADRLEKKRKQEQQQRQEKEQQLKRQKAEEQQRSKTYGPDEMKKTLGVASRPPLADRLEMMLKEVAQILSSLMRSPEDSGVETKLLEITDVMIMDIRISEAILGKYDDSHFKHLKELACHLGTSLARFSESCVEGILSSKAGIMASRKQILRGITRTELGRISKIIKGLRLAEENPTSYRAKETDLDFSKQSEQRRRMSIQTAAGNPLKVAAFDKTNPMAMTVENIKCNDKFVISVTNDIKTEEFSTEWSLYIHSLLEAVGDNFHPSTSITKHVVLKQLSHSVNSVVRTSSDGSQVTLDFITRQVNAHLACLAADSKCPVCGSFALIDPTTKVLVPPTLYIPNKKLLAHLPCVNL